MRIPGPVRDAEASPPRPPRGAGAAATRERVMANDDGWSPRGRHVEQAPPLPVRRRIGEGGRPA